MTRPTCEVSAPPLPDDPPATARVCGVPAERVTGVVGDDESGWRVSRTVEREALR